MIRIRRVRARKLMKALALLIALIAAPAQARDVTFDSAGYRLVGTLDEPASGRPEAGILIIPGSGLIDRDGVPRPAPKRPAMYRQWGESLAQAGYLVLRYDKRTVTHPVDYTSFDEEAQIADALAALAFLRTQAGIRRVYLVGHSEGGNLATVMASRSPGIAGLAVVNSAQFPIDELLLAQLKALPSVSKSDYDAVERHLATIKAGSFPKGGLLLGASGAYWTQWIDYSQRSPVTLAELAIPVLLVQSLEDESLPGETLARNLDRLRAVTKTNRNAQLRELSGLDHSTLNRGGRKVSPDFIRTLVEWLESSR